MIMNMLMVYAIKLEISTDYDRPSAFRICLALERIASSISFIVAVLTGPDFVCMETRNERASNAGSIT